MMNQERGHGAEARLRGLTFELSCPRRRAV
jgi:hypothetical protein